jgi:predicted DNA-binding transcriptional regulator AlpA
MTISDADNQSSASEFTAKPAFAILFPQFPPLCPQANCRNVSAPQLNQGTKVNTISISDTEISRRPRSNVILSPWVNEPLPPLQELLSAHDVARLTRRPKFVISGLVLLRRFPKKRRFRGHQIGWLRAEVLDWMTRDLAIDDRPEEPATRRCAKVTPQQPCLPLECTSACVQEQLQAAFSTSTSARQAARNRGRGR